MIKDERLLSDFEDDEIRKERLSYEEALKIFEALWQEGISLGALPLKEPLEGIEDDIRLARIINSCLKDL